MNLALIKFFECGKVEPLRALWHFLKDVTANCEVEVGITYCHLEHSDNIAVCISEYTAHCLIVHAWPTHLLHALNIYAVYIDI